MQKIIEVVFGLGGYDETKPNNNIVEVIWGEVDEEIEE